MIYPSIIINDPVIWITGSAANDALGVTMPAYFAGSQIELSDPGQNIKSKAFVTASITSNNSPFTMWNQSVGGGHFKFSVVANDNANFEAAYAFFEATCYTSGSLAFVGRIILGADASPGASTWGANLAISGGNLQLFVTGATGKTINWKMKMEEIG